MNNLFTSLPTNLEREVFEDIVSAANVRIERIVSKGHTSPAEGWYDQDEHEWVVVLEGAGTIGFEDGREVTLQRGDCLNIPAHTKHRVAWTAPDRPTIWLAVFYS